MSYRGRGRGHPNFSVTSSQDGTRRTYNNNSWQHDDRYQSNQSNQSNRRGQRGSRGSRGGTRYKNFNSKSSRFRYQRTDADEDGDISMSGDSSQRGRGGYSSSRRGNQRYSGRQRGGSSGRHERWYRVMIPFGARMSQEELLRMITSNYEGEFKPFKYKAEEHSERVIFYIEGGSSVEGLKGLSRRITKPDGHKMVFHITPAPDFHCVDGDTEEKLKVRMSDRYDPTTQKLDLKDLFNDEVLKEKNIRLGLNKISTMDSVTQIVKQYIPELTGLDVSNNRLLSLGHMRDLVKATPGLTSLNLGHNQFRSVEEMDKIKGWKNLTEIILDGNNVRNNYNSITEYISAVRKYFPKVMKLDGQVLPPPVKFDSVTDLVLPPSKDCHFVNDEIKNLVVSFTKEFYTIYDSDRRRDLMAAYHENAQFSMCVSKNPWGDRPYGGFNLYLDESRNLKKIGHLDTDKLVRKTKTGVLGVVSMLEALPKTTHDLASFKMDVNTASPTMLSFVLHGLFKETESRTDKTQIRCFSRTVITVPSGPGMVITNDMLTIANASYDQAKKAFKSGAPTPSSSPANQSQPRTDVSGAPASTYTPEQMELVRRFIQDSGMNSSFSLKCLEENAWDYQKAGQIFAGLQSAGKIPPEAFVKVEPGTM